MAADEDGSVLGGFYFDDRFYLDTIDPASARLANFLSVEDAVECSLADEPTIVVIHHDDLIGAN